MSIWKNGKLIAGGSQALPLLTFMWADHQLNHPSWLRADTFSWHTGSSTTGVYQAAYAHLSADITGKTLQSETVGGTTVQFYLADDGHKICPASEESNVAAIYNATGVAWYFIIDTANQRFKLPRTKFGFTGLRTGVGDYVEPGLPNITANAAFSYGTLWPTTMTGAFKSSGNHGTRARGESGTSPTNLELDASASNPIYKDGATVQPPATEMYLYFYVGAFTQTALENTAGLNTEMFNDLNAHKVIEFQEPTAANNYTWYRKYADGWVEQGGHTIIPSAKYIDVTLPIPMQDNHYTPMITAGWSSSATGQNEGCDSAYKTNTTMRLTASYASVLIWWQVSGMAA